MLCVKMFFGRYEMKKGISFYFGYEIETNKRAKLIKDSGLDCVMTCVDTRFKRENGTLKNQINAFKQQGLEITSLHMQYKSSDLPHFWKKDYKGYKLYKTLIKDIKIANKYGFICVVVHLKG